MLLLHVRSLDIWRSLLLTPILRLLSTPEVLSSPPSSHILSFKLSLSLFPDSSFSIFLHKDNVRNLFWHKIFFLNKFWLLGSLLACSSFKILKNFVTDQYQLPILESLRSIRFKESLLDNNTKGEERRKVGMPKQGSEGANGKCCLIRPTFGDAS